MAEDRSKNMEFISVGESSEADVDSISHPSDEGNGDSATECAAARKNASGTHLFIVAGFAVAAVVHFLAAYSTFALVPLIGGVLAAVIAIIELFTKRMPWFAAVAVLTLLVFMSQIAGPMLPKGQEGYAQQHAYQSFLLRDVVAHFPDELPDNAQDYSMTYCSMFEDELPLYAVQFRTDTDTAAMLAHRAEANALTVFNYSDYLGQTDVYLRKMELMSGSKDFTLVMYAPMEIKDPEGWKVYIQYTSLLQSYPKTGAVMVNVDSGEVCCFKYG